MPRTFIIGSRASKLAQVQTYSIKDALESAHPGESFDVAFMLTGGDKNKVDPLYLFGAAGKALWTEELETALLKDRTIDFIVHSLKDVPTTLPPGAELGAIFERHDPLDSLVVKKGLEYKTLEDLPDGSVVGTSSIRRVAQLRRSFPKLIFSDMVRWLYTPLSSCIFFYFAHFSEGTCRFPFSSYSYETNSLTCPPPSIVILVLPSSMHPMAFTPLSFSPMPD